MMFPADEGELLLALLILARVGFVVGLPAGRCRPHRDSAPLGAFLPADRLTHGVLLRAAKLHAPGGQTMPHQRIHQGFRAQITARLKRSHQQPLVVLARTVAVQSEFPDLWSPVAALWGANPFDELTKLRDQRFSLTQALEIDIARHVVQRLETLHRERCAPSPEDMAYDPGLGLLRPRRRHPQHSGHSHFIGNVITKLRVKLVRVGRLLACDVRLEVILIVPRLIWEEFFSPLA